MGFSRQEYWSGLPFLPPGDRPDPGVEPASPVVPALTGKLFTTETFQGFLTARNLRTTALEPWEAKDTHPWGERGRASSMDKTIRD